MTGRTLEWGSPGGLAACPACGNAATLDLNDRGQIAGVYADAQRMGHGYVRDRNGAFTTIDVPGATLTFRVRQHGRRARRHGA